MKKRYKWIIGLFLAPLAFLILVIFLVYLPPVQRFIINKATEHICETTDYKIDVKDFSLRFPLELHCNNAFVVKQKDTLLRFDSLAAKIKLWPLFKKEIIFEEVNLNRFKINTQKELKEISVKGGLETLKITQPQIFLANDSIDLQQCKLLTSKFKIKLLPSVSKVKNDTTSTNNWKINLNEIAFQQTDFTLEQVEDTSSIHVVFREALLDSIYTCTRDFQVKAKLFSLQKATIEYQKGMIRKPSYKLSKVRNLNVRLNQLSLSLKTLRFDKLLLKTPYSSIDATSLLHLSSFNKRGKGISKLKLSAQVGYKDLIHLVDTARFKLPAKALSVVAKLKGNSSHLLVSPCYINWPGLLSLQFTGNAHYLASKKHRNGRFKLSYSQEDQGFDFGDFILPEQSSLTLEGKLKDQQCEIKGLLAKDDGEASIEGVYHFEHQEYSSSISFTRFNLHSFLPKDSLFHLTAQAQIEGTGWDPFLSQTQLKAKGFIHHFAIGKQIWKNVDANAILQNRQSTITLSCHNKMIDIDGTIKSFLAPHQLYTRINMLIHKADFKLMGYSDVPFKTRMRINSTLQSDLANSHRLTGEINQVNLNIEHKNYDTDCLKFNFLTQNDSTYIHIDSDDFKTNFFSPNGYEQLLSQVDSTFTYLKDSLALEKDLPLRVQSQLPVLSFNCALANQNLLSHYLAQKGIYWDAIEWNIKTSPLHGIHSKTTLKNVGVNNIHLDTLSLQLLQDSSTIAVKGIASNQKKGKLPFFHGTIEGMAQSNWAELTFSYLNEKKDSTFHVGIKASKAGNRITTSIFPKNPILFGGEFTANDSNYIAFEKDKPIEARLRIIDKKGTGISLYSMENPTAQQDLSLELHRLDLKNIAQSISEELQLSGILNTDLHFIKQNDLPILVNNINVEALNYNQQDLGNLNLTTDYIPSSDTEHAVETHLYLNDEEHMMISGAYHGGHKEKLESELSFFNFPLSFVSAFIPPQMLQLKGQLNGEMALRGKIDRLKANGFVRFDSTAISSRLIGTRSTLANHPVKVKNNKLRFNRFAMISSNGSRFTMDGNIDFSVIDKPKIDLKMNATNYEVLKAKRSPEALLYGKLYVDLKTRIKGTPSLLDIKGNIKVAGNSDVTYVISESALTVENRLENMVTFTNFKDRPSIRNNTVQEHYEMEGIQMLMNIDVDEGAFLNIDLDKKQKNYVKLQGGGHLTLQYSPQTDLQLSGKYLLNDGEMKYSLPIIPLKTFHIGKGSFLEWINDPMNPKLNITATEKMRSNVTLNSQSMPVDFNVGVKITNSLSNMGVSFLIDAPENSTIQNDLATMSVSQRNKQAIAMLVTGVYLGGETSNGGKLNASNALNSFLQSEISSIAKSALKSVDISLGVEQVDENGDGKNHTDYSFRFAKRFWNNRLSIIIGGKVSSGTNRNDNAIIEDVALEWRLDKSGTRYVTLFHKQTYDNILDSEIKKTGVGIVLRKKMTKLGELFIFRRKKKTVKNETKK